MSEGEFEIIDKYFANIGWRSDEVQLGPAISSASPRIHCCQVFTFRLARQGMLRHIAPLRRTSATFPQWAPDHWVFSSP